MDSINSIDIRGVQSIQAQYNVNIAPLKFLGMRQMRYYPLGAQIGTLNLSTFLISTDEFLRYTGEVFMNGYILKNKNNVSENFGFTSGYLNSYNLSCGVGQIPTLNVQLSVLGNMGKIPSSDAEDDFFDGDAGRTGLFIATPGSISLTMDGFDTDKVNAFDVSINVNRNPDYVIGNKYPTGVNISYPIEVNCNFNIPAKEYSAYTLRSFPSTSRTGHLTLSLNDYVSNTTIVSYSFGGLQLTSEGLSVDVNGEPTVNLGYKTFLTR